MGWYFNTNQTVKQLVAELVREGDLSPHEFVAGVLYGVAKIEVKGELKKVVLVYLTEKGSMGSGYKPMDETMGPSVAGCPLHILDAADPPLTEWAKTWREKCREYAKYQETA